MPLSFGWPGMTKWFQMYDGVKHEVLKHADKFEAVVGALDKHWGV